MDPRTVIGVNPALSKSVMRVIVALAIASVPALVGAGEPVVPALPGAQPSQVDPTLSSTPAASAEQPANAEALRQQLEQVNDRLAKLHGALPVAASAQATDGLAASNGQAMSAGAAIIAPRETPSAPTDDEVLRLEKRLARARAQIKADTVADAGLVTATSASALRARVVFPYTDGSIYEVYAAPDRMTAIELEPGEIITTDNGKPKAADTVQWVADTVSTGEGAQRQTIVLVKPIVSGIETNLLIPTNHHLYSILLRSESQSYMPLVAFNYPFDEAREGAKVAAAAAAADSEHEKTSVAPESLNFAYKLKGAKVVWRPLRVFDDGTKTYLQMPLSMQSWEAPALFVMDDARAPQLVNYRVKGDYYIVDRLFHKAQLRVGTKQFVDIAREDSRG